ncbi:MAG: PocR ligand-binding domain-containing protein [Kiritimatiellae bacterium]|nr:PocR ligand-binding domain-containing protein [Kiritimatiellia bacterium]
MKRTKDTDSSDASENFLVDDKFSIGDLVDLNHLRELFDKFSKATGFTLGLIEHPSRNVLIATGWRSLCTQFRRTHPTVAEVCAASDRQLLDRVVATRAPVMETCAHGLINCVTPVLIKGKHIASLITGQFFLQKPDIEWFKQQARRLGLDEEKYLGALDEIPVVDEERLKNYTAFLSYMAEFISQMGYARLTAEHEANQRRRSESHARDSEHKFRALIDHMNDGFLVCRLEDHRIVSCNTTLVSMLGYSRNELLRMTLGDLYPENDWARVRELFEQQAHSELKTAPHTPVRRKDGGVFYADISAVALSIEGIPCLMVVFRDITEHIAAEQEQRRLQESLVQTQKLEAIGKLAGGIAHDFNNQLTAIMGHADLAMSNKTLAPEVRGDLEGILRAAEHSAELTDHLLSFAHKRAIAPKILDVNERIARVMKMLHRIIGEQIYIDWQPGTEIWPIEADPTQIDQVLINLCVNARDAIQGPGRIAIRTRNTTILRAYQSSHGRADPGDYVVLSVSDDGCGMDREVLEKIFEPYFTTKETGKGTGLGLAIVYGIVTQTGGFIQVASESAKGTTFAIHFRRHLPARTLEAREAMDVAAKSRGETVLLVEPNAPARNSPGLMLESLGYRVITASTPREALQIAQSFEGPIDVLITDAILPEMDGVNLLERIREVRPDVKAIYLAERHEKASLGGAALSGDEHWMERPFAPKELALRIRRVLEME